MSDQHDINAPVDPLDEQLTAYLDGELDAVEARELEMRLARDEGARERLRELAGAWDMLDNLPRTTVDQNFSRTTVALVVQEAAKEVQQLKNKTPVEIRQRWIATVAAIAAAIFVGFVGLNLMMPDPNRQLVDEYTLVENWQLYREAGSIDFLEKLNAQKLFAAETAEEAANNTEFVSFERNSTEVQSDLKKLEENQRAELRRKYEEFQKLTPDQIAQLRKFDADLRKRPDAEQLFHVMQSYYDWLTLRPPVESLQLSELTNTDERVNKTRELLSKGNTAADKFKQLAWVYKDEILNAEGENWKKWFNDSRNDNRNDGRQKIIIAKLFLKHLHEDSPANPDSILAKLSETHYSQLMEKLPDEARKQAAAHVITPQMSAEKKRETMQAGIKIASKSIEQVLRFNNVRRGPKEEELKAFLDGLKPEQREKLMHDYPAVEDFNRELRRMYGFAMWQQRGGPGGNRNGKGGYPSGQFRGDFGQGPDRGPNDRGPGGMRNGQGPRGDGSEREGDPSGEFRRGGKRYGPPGDRGSNNRGSNNRGPNDRGPSGRGPGDHGPGDSGKGDPPGFGPPPDDGPFGGPVGREGRPPRPPEFDDDHPENSPPHNEPRDGEKGKQQPAGSDSKKAPK